MHTSQFGARLLAVSVDPFSRGIEQKTSEARIDVASRLAFRCSNSVYQADYRSVFFAHITSRLDDTNGIGIEVDAANDTPNLVSRL